MKKSSNCFSIIIYLLQYDIYPRPNLLGRIFFLFFSSPQWLSVYPSLPPTILSLSKTPKILNIPSLQSISPISPNCHPPIISHEAFKFNIFLKVIIFITSLMALILHHHPPSPSLVLHPQIWHTQPGSIMIVSSLTLSLVLSLFRYNYLLPAPPLPLMHDNLNQYLCQTISWSY